MCPGQWQFGEKRETTQRFKYQQGHFHFIGSQFPCIWETAHLWRFAIHTSIFGFERCWGFAHPHRIGDLPIVLDPPFSCLMRKLHQCSLCDSALAVQAGQSMSQDTKRVATKVSSFPPHAAAKSLLNKKADGVKVSIVQGFV